MENDGRASQLDNIDQIKANFTKGVAVSVASLAVTVGMGAAVVDGINYWKKANDARLEMKEIEKNAEVSLVQDGLGFRPSERMQGVINDAESTINQASVSLSIPAELVCNIKSLRDVSTKLDKSCTLVAINKPIESAYRAHLAETNYEQLLPYQTPNNLRESTQPLVGIVFGAVFATISLFSLGNAVRQSSRYIQAKDAIINSNIEVSG